MWNLKRRIIFAVLFLTISCLVFPVSSQSIAQENRADDPYEHLKLGRWAMERGQRLEAYKQYLGALTHSPGTKEIVEVILELAADDADARALWSHAWYGLASDASGRARPGMKVKALLSQDDPHLAKVAAARARAVVELAGFAEARQNEGNRSPDEYLVAQWARGLAIELARDAPALESGPVQSFLPKLKTPFTIYKPVVKALEQAMNHAIANRRTGLAMRAARCLHGIGVQGGFKDLKGERPKNIKAVAKIGGDGLRKARQQLAKKVGKPWTVDELGWLTGEEAEAFTREHCSFSNPGVAVSPNERYRIETDCGYETLLGVAETVEYHHRRLVNWFGQDPFEGKQGTVRIVPEAWGLEAEGAPFWWAGGFQGGPTTVMRLSFGTIEGLGHGITHELTHRFDGAINPGIPAWLAEGRACWTGGAYGDTRDKNFVPNHASIGTIVGQLGKGYGNIQKLKPLIDGTVEDYRENYGAGYVLYVYLSSWEEEGRKLYADRLERFMRGCPKNRNRPGSWFVKNFADGKEGRPDGLEEFAEAFRDFMSGFTGKKPAPWTKRYTQKVPPGGESRLVYDEPTLTWSRVRAEPFFGQGQACEAGMILLDAGKRDEAAPAFVWALSVDGRMPRVERLLSETLTKLNRKDGAWVMRHACAFPFSSPEKPAPFLGLLRQTRTYVRALEEASAAYGSSGLAWAAAALNGDRNRIAAWLGMPRRETPVVPEGDLLYPFDSIPRHAGTEGWKEEELVGFEEHRRPELWYTADNGDLHIGRKKPRSATGRVDRSAYPHHIFARGYTWQFPGAYRIKTRIKYTTAVVRGAVVFGYARRDLNLRFQFAAGDPAYASGAKDENPAFDSVEWSLNGMRPRDGSLPGSAAHDTYNSDRPIPAFNLELLIEGPTVQAFINGMRTGTYHTVDGAPIEGYIGFAGSYGSYVAQKPTVERLDRSPMTDLPGRLPLGLDLSRDQARSFKNLANLPFQGLPESSNGTLLIWIPMPWLEEGETFDPDEVVIKARAAVKKIKELMDRKQSPQPCIVVIPDAIGEDRIAAFKAEMEQVHKTPPGVLTHLYLASIATPDPVTPDLNQRWFMFVDSANIIRLILPLAGLMMDRDFEDTVLHWLTVFRDHGHPTRNLPKFKREIEEEEIEEGAGEK